MTHSICSSFLPNDRSFIMGTTDGKLTTIHVDSQQCTQSVQFCNDPVTNVIQFKGDCYITSVEKAIFLWKDTFVRSEYHEHDDPILDLRSINNFCFASGDKKRVVIWTSDKRVATLTPTLDINLRHPIPSPLVRVSIHKIIKAITFDSTIQPTVYIPSHEGKWLEGITINAKPPHPSFQKICTFKGHSEPISAAITMDETVITASYDKTIKVWEPYKRGRCVKTLRGHQGKITDLIHVGKGLFASGSFDGRILVWDRESTAPIISMEHPDTHRIVKIARFGKNYLASIGYTQNRNEAAVALWSLERGSHHATKPAKQLRDRYGLLQIYSPKNGDPLIASIGGEITIYHKDEPTHNESGASSSQTRVESGLPSEYVDPVTFEPMTTPMVLTACGHTFDASTIETLQQSNCPTCRSEITGAVENYALKGLIQERNRS